jgi:hypothetical protein
MEYSVNELIKSPSGREYLARMQEAYKEDIAQPGTPLFDKVYGDKIRRDKINKEKRERIARDMREEIEQKKRWKKQNQWRTR